MSLLLARMYEIVRIHFVLNDDNDFLGRVLVEFTTQESAKKVSHFHRLIKQLARIQL